MQSARNPKRMLYSASAVMLPAIESHSTPSPAVAAASQVLLAGYAAMIAADLIFALVPSVYGTLILT